MRLKLQHAPQQRKLTVYVSTKLNARSSSVLAAWDAPASRNAALEYFAMHRSSWLEHARQQPATSLLPNACATERTQQQLACRSPQVRHPLP